MKHPWFANFEWDALERGTLKAPFVPDLEEHMDVSHFSEVEPHEEGEPCYDPILDQLFEQQF